MAEHAPETQDARWNRIINERDTARDLLSDTQDLLKAAKEEIAALQRENFILKDGAAEYHADVERLEAQLAAERTRAEALAVKVNTVVTALLRHDNCDCDSDSILWSEIEDVLMEEIAAAISPDAPPLQRAARGTRVKLKDVPMNPLFQPQVDRAPGVISARLTAWCGGCSDWWDIATTTNKAKAAQQLRRDGWKLTRARGWLCPTCVQQGGSG